MRALRTLAAAGALLLGGLLSAPAASAAGALRAFTPEDFDGTEHFAAGENDCVPWAGTFHEVRHGGYDVVAAPGGQVPGETHVNGAVDGYVELVPDDPTLPSYAGGYREKVNGIFLGVDANGDDELRVAHFVLIGILTGTDGSTLRLDDSGKVTVDGQGRVRVERVAFRCS
jgi:hypothetical protein